MNNQRLRNLSTGILHTKMEDIYSDVEFIIGEKGVMTHHLPNALEAMRPWLRERLKDPRFWDCSFDTSHTGETQVNAMGPDDRKAFWDRFRTLPDPLRRFSSPPKEPSTP